MEGNPNLLWDGFDRFALGSDVLIAPRQPANFYPYNFSSDGTADLTCPVQSPGEDKFVSPPQGPQYEVQISIQELLCNRLQWYYVTCKFVSPQGTPCCVGQPITFDPRIVFRDGRRRNSQRNTGNDIVLNLWGTCASTGQEVRKCSRCIEKDKVLTQRKRKRDTSLVWNESDDESNSRLIQVLTSGNEVVDSCGEVKFRIRIGCCVGVNKQHHLNHGSSDGTVEMHKGCPGLTLSLSVSEKASTIASVSSQPLRILGKVTTADRKKFGPQSGDSSSFSSSSSSGFSSSSSGFSSSGLSNSSNGYSSSVTTTSTSTQSIPSIPGQSMQHQHTHQLQQQQQQHSVPLVQPVVQHLQQTVHHLQPQQQQQQHQHQQQQQPAQHMTHSPVQVHRQMYHHNTNKMFSSSDLPLVDPTTDYLNDSFQPLLMNTITDPSSLQPATYNDPNSQALSPRVVASSTLLCQAVSYYLQVDPCDRLYELALAFRDSFGTVFSTSIPLFSSTFFSSTNLRSIPEDSSVMLQIYVIIAIGACIKSQAKLAETLIAKATELSSVFLSNTKILSDVDSLLVADSLNLIGCYFSSLGDLSKAVHYNKEAYHLLEILATNGKPQLLNTNAYGNTVWSRLTYNANIATLENGFEWAKIREKQPMMAYSLCLLISALCTPDCFYKGNAPVEEHLHRLLLDLFGQLESTIETARYREVTEGSRTYRKLVDYGLAAMKCWLMGNYTQAGEYIEETAIQAALISSPSMEAFVPLYLASFVSLQLSQKSQETFRDLSEIILRALVRVTSFRWARSLIDIHISFFDSSLGWSSGITWPDWSQAQQASSSPTSSSLSSSSQHSSSQQPLLSQQQAPQQQHSPPPHITSPLPQQSQQHQQTCPTSALDLHTHPGSHTRLDEASFRI